MRCIDQHLLCLIATCKRLLKRERRRNAFFNSEQCAVGIDVFNCAKLHYEITMQSQHQSSPTCCCNFRAFEHISSARGGPTLTSLCLIEGCTASTRSSSWLRSEVHEARQRLRGASRSVFDKGEVEERESQLHVLTRARLHACVHAQIQRPRARICECRHLLSCAQVNSRISAQTRKHGSAHK
eukprot:2978372-Pleurochrysis_carterae.AAC.1